MTNRFEKHKFLILVSITLPVILIISILAEVGMEKFMGLGNPILYDSSPIYGFRPLPGRTYTRFRGKEIKFNNLGIRANEDWHGNIHNKILFLGDSVTYGGSYISNQELFSYLAIKDFQGWQSGNAGVNAWGVENIYGLVVETNFTPAKVYVTTLMEEDFYRGVTKIIGAPFFNISPRYAFKELWLYFCCGQNNKRYMGWESYATPAVREYVIQKAVEKLKKMDTFLKNKGFQHLIFITPYKDQVLGIEGKDTLIANLFTEYKLKPIYILDKLPRKLDVENLFHDQVHLEKMGHEVWGALIKEEIRGALHLEDN
jgi:hypothetical protein